MPLTLIGEPIPRSVPGVYGHDVGSTGKGAKRAKDLK